MQMRRALVLGALLAVGACGRGSSGSDESTVTVLAASSLTGAFTEIAESFEATHDGVSVALSFDGSARLATAILEGAPADVFASADEPNLQRLLDEGLTDGGPVVFATNHLQIVVEAGNPLAITSLAELSDVRLSLCAAAVPCGAYAALAFDRAGLDVPPAGDQENVKGVLTQVQLGEADAGLVYVTDVLAADGVEGVDLPAAQQVEARYPVAALQPGSEDAAAFVAFLASREVQEILERHGFGLP